MSATPATAVATAIQAAGHASLGADLYLGPIRGQSSTRSMPDKAIFVIASGGDAPSQHAGNGEELRYPAVQVTVRSLNDEFESGATLAKAVFDTMHNATLSGYVSCLAEQSEPNYLGTDEQGLHLWTINLFLTVKET